MHNNSSNTKKWYLKPKYIISLAVFLLFLTALGNGFQSALEKNYQPEPNSATQKIKSTPMQEPVAEKAVAESSPEPEQPQYEQLGYENSPVVENYYILVDTTDKAELEKLANQIKDEKCTKDCNIHLFNDKTAYELDQERKRLRSDLNTPREALEQWQEEHYVYVADHLVGMLSFEGGELFTHYPLRDFVYEDLKEV